MRIFLYFIKFFQQIFSIFVFLFLRFQNALIRSIPFEHFIDLRFLDYGMDEEEEDEEEKGHFDDLALCAKMACQKINSLELPKGIDGDALRAHFLLRERMLAKCPLYGYLEGRGLKLAILDGGNGGSLEWMKMAHPECVQKTIYLCPNSSKCPILAEDKNLLERIEQRRRKMNENYFGANEPMILNFLPNSSVNIFLQIRPMEEIELADNLAEMKRFLCPGGYFCFGGIYSRESYKKLQNASSNAGFRPILEAENISQQICRSMLITWIRFDSILEQVPFWLRPFRAQIGEKIFPNFGQTFEKLRNGELVYLIGCWQKIESIK